MKNGFRDDKYFPLASGDIAHSMPRHAGWAAALAAESRRVAQREILFYCGLQALAMSIVNHACNAIVLAFKTWAWRQRAGRGGACNDMQASRLW